MKNEKEFTKIRQSTTLANAITHKQRKEKGHLIQILAKMGGARNQRDDTNLSGDSNPRI